MSGSSPIISMRAEKKKILHKQTAIQGHTHEIFLPNLIGYNDHVKKLLCFPLKGKSQP